MNHSELPLADQSFPSVKERRETFRKLHEDGCFVIPNPWNVGSARWLAQAGFKALATSSSGYAFSRGLPDGEVGVDEVVHHCREIVNATPLPVNADFEDGHAGDLDQLADNIQRCVETGVAGLSIEDSTGDANQPLYPLNEAKERMETARTAIDETGQDVMLIGRAECFLTGHPDPLNESLRRLETYATAGADCLYAPGLTTKEQITSVVDAVTPKPVNVLVGSDIQFTVDDLKEMGVRRISIGGALARTAWTGFINAIEPLKEGRFDGFKELVSHPKLNQFFSF